MNKVISYITARLKEPSTRQAVVVLVGAVGIKTVSPEMAGMLFDAVVAVFTVVSVFTKEGSTDKEK